MWTTNLCINPSFQNGLQGYEGMLGTEELFLDDAWQLFGRNSLRVTTRGLIGGEGCITASGIMPATGSASLSLYVAGKGNINVSVYLHPGDNLQATFPVTLTSEFSRVIINDIPAFAGETLYMKVYTTTKQATSFWICGIQIEPFSPAHDYCDGDRDGCVWIDYPFGRSVQEFQWPASATGISISSGPVVPVLDISAIVYAEVAPGKSRSTDALVYTGLQYPVAAMTDFAIYTSGQPDPAQTYVSWNNSGTNCGTGSSYSRVWSTFFPPQDYPVSGGQLLWSRAARMSAGFQYTSVTHGQSVDVTDIQAELLPAAGSHSVPAPSAYQLPREINTIVKPDRLNYCPNPSIEISTSGWTAMATASLTQDTSQSVGDIIEYDDFQYTAGVASLNVSMLANSDGAEIQVPDLIVGETYIVSMYLMAGPGLENIVSACGNGTNAIKHVGVPFGISGGYGAVPYGGVSLSDLAVPLGPLYGAGIYGAGEYSSAIDLPTSDWVRLSYTFEAQQSTETLTVYGVSAIDVSYPARFWVDAVLIEVGEVLDYYFDGSFGTNYFWETGGTPGLTRSYYYDQYYVKQQAFLNALAGHVPLGISYAQPIYNIPYTQ